MRVRRVRVSRHGFLLCGSGLFNDVAGSLKNVWFSSNVSVCRSTILRGVITPASARVES